MAPSELVMNIRYSYFSLPSLLVYETSVPKTRCRGPRAVREARRQQKCEERTGRFSPQGALKAGSGWLERFPGAESQHRWCWALGRECLLWSRREDGSRRVNCRFALKGEASGRGAVGTGNASPRHSEDSQRIQESKRCSWWHATGRADASPGRCPLPPSNLSQFTVTQLTAFKYFNNFWK